MGGQLPSHPLPHASLTRNSRGGGASTSSPRDEPVLGRARRLTGLAHATGPHHGDLDQAAPRHPQAAVGGSRGAARGGVLGDGAHVLNEAHRRSSPSCTTRDGTCGAGSLLCCAGASWRTQPERSEVKRHGSAAAR